MVEDTVALQREHSSKHMSLWDEKWPVKATYGLEDGMAVYLSLYITLLHTRHLQTS